MLVWLLTALLLLLAGSALVAVLARRVWRSAVALAGETAVLEQRMAQVEAVIARLSEPVVTVEPPLRAE